MGGLFVPGGQFIPIIMFCFSIFATVIGFLLVRILNRIESDIKEVASKVEKHIDVENIRSEKKEDLVYQLSTRVSVLEKQVGFGTLR